MQCHSAIKKWPSLFTYCFYRSNPYIQRWLVWKVSKYGVSSGPYFPVFRTNTGKYEPKNSVFGHAINFEAIATSSFAGKCIWKFLELLFKVTLLPYKELMLNLRPHFLTNYTKKVYCEKSYAEVFIKSCKKLKFERFRQRGWQCCFEYSIN